MTPLVYYPCNTLVPMVIGERFAWAHIPKTAGDLTLALFESIVPDLVVEADPPHEQRKHEGFERRGRAVCRKPILAANIRRLPNHQLSGAYHRYLHGFGPLNFKPLPMASPGELASTGMADRRLKRVCSAHGRSVDVWLRTERLREDFVDFVSRLRPLTDDERTRALTVNPGKSIHDYDHDPTHFFTREQIERLYESNPMWAAIELEVYGDLAIPDEADGREPGADEPWWQAHVDPAAALHR